MTAGLLLIRQFMEVIIAEKPSVAQSIARVVGAGEKHDGYLEGSGYRVTWAFGHLIQLALPEAYGYKGWKTENLPMLPDKFKFIPIQVRQGRTYRNDEGALKQLRIIGRLFEDADTIINAGDAGREGEVIQRLIYSYLGCHKPVRRLWLNSLTEEAIRKGMKSLRPGSDFDNLYKAGLARMTADWLVGMNATQACSLSAGGALFSIGRVQTPTLAMICRRYEENRAFVSEPFWQITVEAASADTSTVRKQDSTDSPILLTSSGKWKSETEAALAFHEVSVSQTARILKIARNTRTEQPPLLYDLTSLQKDANSRHGYTADRTLNIAQSLYEKELVTYPRTGSRYIPEDVFSTVPALLDKIQDTRLKAIAKAVSSLSRNSVDDAKVTDHHALLPTGVSPEGLRADEQTVYDMITARMVEAFSQTCIKDTAHVAFDIHGYAFSASGTVVRQSGWRAVLNEKEKDRTRLPAEWKEDDLINIRKPKMSQGQTKPKPLHTEGSLLDAMETCGKDIDDVQLREAIKDCGIGTPATRASIIETLVSRGYIERSMKSLIPTAKGLELYHIVKDMDIANATLTGQWEKQLADIEQGKGNAADFSKGIIEYTRHITGSFLGIRIHSVSANGPLCPKCHEGHIQFFAKVAKCSNPDCDFHIFRTVAQKKITEKDLTDLITKGETGFLRGFKSKAGKSFPAKLKRDGDGKLAFVFPINEHSKLSRH